MRTVFQVEGKEPMHMENRAGYYKTDLSGEMASLLVKANSGLAVLESVATCIPNVDLFVSMYVCKEALMSSQIEGTQATLEDVLDPLIDANINRNVADGVNYIKATEFAVKRLEIFAYEAYLGIFRKGT